MKTILLLFLLAIIGLSPACKKNEANPCDGLAWMIAPTAVGMIYLDKETGENILKTKKISTKDITITPEVGFRVDSTSGTLAVFIEQGKAGAYKYAINIPGVGTTTLAYINEEVVTGFACHPTKIVVGDPIVGDDPFTVQKVSTDFVITIKH
jgi:hypothetical protein